MTHDPYYSIKDPYCYPDSAVLKNKTGISDQAGLEALERRLTKLRFDEPLPAGSFDPAHYRAIHRHLFQDIFDWAGEYRTVRISKGGSMFCYPEFIEAEMTRAFAQLAETILGKSIAIEIFAHEAAQFLADLNAIHPFREGNGRTQLSFLAALSEHAGYEFSLDMTEPGDFLAAMIDSFKGNTESLERALLANLRPICL